MKHQGFRQHLVWLLIAVHGVTISGCSTTNVITLPGNEFPVGSNFTIAEVILKSGEIVEFDSDGGWYVDKTKDAKSYRVIVGTTNGKKVEIDPEKVLEVTFEQEESGGTGNFLTGLFIGLPVGALAFYLILLAIYSSNL